MNKKKSFITSIFTGIFKIIKFIFWRFMIFLSKVGKIIEDGYNDYKEKKSTLNSIKHKYRDEF